MKRIWNNGMALLLVLAMLLPMLGTVQPVMADTGEGHVTEAAVPNGYGGVSVGVTRESDGIVRATEEREPTASPKSSRTIMDDIAASGAAHNSRVSVNAIWDGDDPGDRPESMTIQLRMDGIEYGDPVQLKAGDAGNVYGGTGGNFTVDWPETKKGSYEKKVKISTKNYSVDLGGTGTARWYTDNKFPTDATYISNLKVGPLNRRVPGRYEVLKNDSYSFAFGTWKANDRIYDIYGWDTRKGDSTYKLFAYVDTGNLLLSKDFNLDADDNVVEKVIYPTDGDICFSVYNVTNKAAEYVDVSWNAYTQVMSSATCSKADVRYEFAVDERGWLEISKPEDEADPDKTVTYTYTITDENGNVVGDLQLKAGESGKIENLPAGTYYVAESFPRDCWSYEWTDLPDYHSWTVDVVGTVDGYVSRILLDPVVSDDGGRDIDCEIINIPLAEASSNVRVIVHAHCEDDAFPGQYAVLRRDGEETGKYSVRKWSQNYIRDGCRTWTVNLAGFAPEGYTQTIASHIEVPNPSGSAVECIVYDVTFTRIDEWPPDQYSKVHVTVNSEWVGDYRYVFLDNQRSEFDGNGAYWDPNLVASSNFSNGSHMSGMCVRLLCDGLPLPTDVVYSVRFVCPAVWLGPGVRYYHGLGTFQWVENADFGTLSSDAFTDWSMEIDPMPCYDTEVSNPLVEIRDGIKHITYNITNTYTGEVPETTDVIVVYDRLDADPDATLDGVEITAQLCRDGEDFGEPVVLDVENGWQHKWAGLEGAHEWTVKRAGPPAEGYESNETTAAYGVEMDVGMRGYVVCSIMDAPADDSYVRRASSARKVWFDDGGPSRPDTLEVGGYKPGYDLNKEHRDNRWPSSLASATGWKYMWDGMPNYYWNPYEIVPEHYEERFFYNGQLAVFVNISVPESAGGMILPRTGGDGIRNMMMVASVLVLASGLALLGNRRRKRLDG